MKSRPRQTLGSGLLLERLPVCFPESFCSPNGANRVHIRAPSSSSRESVEYSHHLNDAECMEIYKACNDCDLSFEPVHKFLSKPLETSRLPQECDIKSQPLKAAPSRN